MDNSFRAQVFLKPRRKQKTDRPEFLLTEQQDSWRSTVEDK